MNRTSGSCYCEARKRACYDQAMTETERPLRAAARRTRELIMASAGELFARLGIEAQMDQIAEHCGLGLGTLYRHFPTKEALFRAVVQDRMQHLVDSGYALLESAGPGEALFAVTMQDVGQCGRVVGVDDLSRGQR